MELLTAIIVSLIFAAASLVLSELLRPKPNIENARPAHLGDFQFPTATEGRVIPIVWGTVKLKGPNVTWYGDLKQIKQTKTIKTGLWSSKTIVTGFKYLIGIQFALCRGPIDNLRRIWIGDKVAVGPMTTTQVPEGLGVGIDQPKILGGSSGAGGVKGTLRIYAGTEAQDVNPYMGAILGNILPAYRGTCHAVWEQGYIGNSTSIKPWAFEVTRCPNGLGYLDGQHRIDPDDTEQPDANHACVLHEILTNDEWGFGFPDADLDLDNFRTVGQTLFDEENGFSFTLDQARSATDVIQEVERQMNGLLLFDQVTGKFFINLARGGFDIDTIPQITVDNVVEVKEYTRGTWQETSNQVRISFNNRANEYQDTYAIAYDLANQRIQGGTLIAVTQSYPGLKRRSTAANIASRSLKSLSTPLATGLVVVDRSFWNIHPGDVVAWTDATLGFSKLPMRVTRIDFGHILDGKIELSLIQDVFEFAQPFSGTPEDPRWVVPSQGVEPIPSNESSIFEAPKAFVDRDPDFPGVPNRIWAGARSQTQKEVSTQIWQRNDPGTPSGDYVNSGEFFGFLLIGEVRDDVLAPDGTLTIDPDPDLRTTMEDAFTPSPSDSDIGRNLTNLILIGDEFLGVSDVTDNTTYFTIDAFRGLLDTVPAGHVTGTRVYLLFVAGGLTADTIPRGNNVDVKLVPTSGTDDLPIDDATVVSLTMDGRTIRPYPPTAPTLNGDLWSTSVDLDTSLP